MTMTMTIEKSRRTWMATALAASMLVLGCSSSSGETVNSVAQRAETPLPARAGSVVVDGCLLDPWQRATLAGPGAKRVLQDVILLCLVPRLDGTVGPRDPSALQHLGALIADLGTDGYRVSLAVAFTDETGQHYDGPQTRAFLGDSAWRARFRETLLPALAPAAGVELDLQGLPNEARDVVTAFVTEVSQSVRPGKRLGVFVPPSVAIPSDLPGGDAFARALLAKQVDRMRIMTLDFSDQGPGPTIDPGWAADAVRLAKRDAPNVDVAYPLYGTDFGPRGRRSTTYLEAVAMANVTGAAIEHGPTTAPFLRYVAYGNEPHELWFDDLDSTGRALAAWDYDVLP
ncbi:MAG: spore germination protein, partial [Myxococcales bacterium]|nr:spore germination protein [Myxococcales bacterium]